MLSTEATHSLVAHSLDVACVMQLLAPDEPHFPFLASLHDIGKVSAASQSKTSDAPLPDPGHDTVGLYMLREPALARALDPVLRGWRDAERAVLLRSVCGHHGQPPRDDVTPTRPQIGTGGEEVGAELVRLMVRLFAPTAMQRMPPPGLAALAWRLAGMCTLGRLDWLLGEVVSLRRNR